MPLTPCIPVAFSKNRRTATPSACDRPPAWPKPCVLLTELNWKWPCGETPLFIFDRCARGIWWPDFVYRWFVGYSDTYANVATAIAMNTYKGFSYGY